MATIVADSASSGDVQDAIDAASDGDTVQIPADTATWNTPVTCDKAITIEGAGYGSTVITDGGNNGGTLVITCVDGKNTRVTGIGFDCDGSDADGCIYVTGNLDADATFRVDHCRLYNLRERGLVTRSVWGLVDHCLFEAPYNVTGQAVSIFGDNASDDEEIDGAYAWLLPLTLGTANAVYIEDCDFDFAYVNDGVLDAYGGARYVFRYNTISNSTIGHHGTDSGPRHSAHSWEIYENYFETNTNVGGRGFHSRGGTGVIYDNEYINGDYYQDLALNNYRSCGSYAPWGQCDGNSGYDGNTPGYYGWPCYQQNGRTGSDGLTSAPVYGWGNTIDGSPFLLSVSDDCSTLTTYHILEDRDFFNSEHPTYVAYTYPHPLQGGSTEYTGTVTEGLTFGDARVETGLPSAFTARVVMFFP